MTPCAVAAARSIRSKPTEHCWTYFSRGRRSKTGRPKGASPKTITTSASAQVAITRSSLPPSAATTVAPGLLEPLRDRAGRGPSGDDRDRQTLLRHRFPSHALRRFYRPTAATAHH